MLDTPDTPEKQRSKNFCILSSHEELVTIKTFVSLAEHRIQGKCKSKEQKVFNGAG
jgi:hypothetical protein